MKGLYILDDKKNPVEVESLLEWAKTQGEAERRVAIDRIDGFAVSTVFLGVASPTLDNPLLFQTTIIGRGRLNQYHERYATWDQAERGHKRAVTRVKKYLRNEK